AINGFSASGARSEIEDVCSCHLQVFPAESYSAADSEDERLRAITLLQQKAQSRDAELRDVATLSRELRSRLQPICNSLESLESDSSREEARSVIRRQVEQMSHLVDNLLEVSTGNHEKVSANRSPAKLL